MCSKKRISNMPYVLQHHWNILRAAMTCRLAIKIPFPHLKQRMFAAKN